MWQLGHVVVWSPGRVVVWLCYAHLDVLVGAADTLLDGAEGLRVAHLAEFVRHAGRDASEDRRRLFGSCFYHRFSFLVSVLSTYVIYDYIVFNITLLHSGM